MVDHLPAARVTLVDRAEDEGRGRFQVEWLGRLLADTEPRSTATRAQLPRLGEVVDDLAALELFGQPGTAVQVASGRRLVDGPVTARPTEMRFPWTGDCGMTG